MGRCRPYLVVDPKEIRALESLVSKVIVLEIARVHYGGVEELGVLHHSVVECLRHERSRFLRARVHILAKDLHVLAERLVRVLVQVGDADTRCKLGEIGVKRGHVGGRLSRELCSVLNRLTVWRRNEAVSSLRCSGAEGANK